MVTPTAANRPRAIIRQATIMFCTLANLSIPRQFRTMNRVSRTRAMIFSLPIPNSDTK